MESRIFKFLKRCKREQRRALLDPEHYLGNPINAFTLIRRLFADFAPVEKVLNNTSAYRRERFISYPSVADMKGAVEGLTTLETVYSLNVTLLANGQLVSSCNKYHKKYIERVSPMTANDCYEMGQAALQNNDYERLLSWMKAVYDKYRICDSCPFTLMNIVDWIIKTNYMLENYKETINWLKRRISLDPNDPGNTNATAFMSHLAAGNKNKNPIKAVKKNDEDWRLCTGSSSNASLKCRYVHGPHPFLRLAPVKEEQLYHDPMIKLYRDVITDEEIRHIQRLAKPKLWVAKTGTRSGGWQKNRDRITEIMFLASNQSAIVTRFSRRVSLFTGHDYVYGTLQPANYGLCGLFASHVDAFVKAEVGLNRLATVLVYMSDVELGGATVFTKLNLTVFPEKGAALYWDNLHVSGERDFRTEHAACPVLRGSKWVVTKWIEGQGQELVKPCPLKCIAVRDPNVYDPSSAEYRGCSVANIT
ncbi:prolyl 4-hydroxylase subunit alpha-2-like [Pectinophora gossypiella]|uniref:prolyl 4-hydroxylase subunit alpha-2-like n=1 Tax=Pectinophora gossypiella TaxID=13191 RepID=UPI00214E838F|nr:prolyl 4-hydroxylase subunit alpha-2-like [Pectinophora gossypiella]